MKPHNKNIFVLEEHLNDQKASQTDKHFRIYNIRDCYNFNCLVAEKLTIETTCLKRVLKKILQTQT